jgi:hypothetical protein
MSSDRRHHFPLRFVGSQFRRRVFRGSMANGHCDSLGAASKPHGTKLLFAFPRTAIDALSILTVVHQFAPVGVKCRSNFGFHLVL